MDCENLKNNLEISQIKLNLPICLILFAFCLFSSCQRQTSIKVNSKEVRENVNSPILHQKGFKTEKELFGYKPTIDPNVVSFDRSGSPVFRKGLEVWRLNGKKTKWLKEDLRIALKNKYPKWDGKGGEEANYQLDERIVFDQDGAAYTQIYSSPFKGINRTTILYKASKNDSWQVYPIPAPYQFAKIEFEDGFNNKTHPPTISLSGYYIDDLAILLPKKRGKNLDLGKPILITNSGLNPSGGWGGNQNITAGNYVFCTWASKDNNKKKGTSIYIKRYNRTNKKWSKEVYLGQAGTNDIPNSHNIPSLTIDSKDYLHIVMGAHHEHMTYRKSRGPNAIQKWSKAIIIGDTEPNTSDKLNACRSNCGYYTYPSLICDKEDNLHLVTRWAGDTPGYTYYFRLVYHCKKAAAQKWSSRKTVVLPFRAYYSNWYQKLSLDKTGEKVYLFYAYYADQLFPEEAKAYKEKFPSHQIKPNPNIKQPVAKKAGDRAYKYYKNIRANNPILLELNKKNTTWNIVTSNDF